MRIFQLLILTVIILSCSSKQKTVTTDKCPKIYKNNFTEILFKKYKPIADKDSLEFNEMRFECTDSSLYTHKVMFDTFGMWNKEVYPSNSKYPFLVWENITLFDDNKKYNVYTYGLEEWKHIYASVMVFDENNMDLLASNQSEEKNKLTNYFSNMIQSLESNKTDFYQIYWMAVDPEKYNTLFKVKYSHK